MKHWLLLVIVAGFTAASTGCAIVDSGRSAMVDTARMMRPRPHDGPAEIDDAEDEWGFVGEEGRRGQERQRDQDRWWHNLVMSQEARNIERNLGFD